MGDTVKTRIKDGTSGLRTLGLKFGQESTIYIRDWSRSTARGEGLAGAFQNMVVRKYMTHPFHFARN